MDVLSSLLNGFQTALSLQNLYLCFIGCLWGTMVGVLPGIGPLAGITLLIPATFGLNATGAIIMLAGIYYGAMYGGSTTSILMNVPGESASVVTCIDGYQMTLKGRGGAALFISAWGSWIGGTLSIIGLMVLAPTLANFAMKFGPPEMFAVLLVAFILLGSLGSGSFFRTMPMVFLGLLIGTIGMDPLTGSMRFTHNIPDLYDGIGLLPVAMGAMGIGEILIATEENLVRVIHKIKFRELWPTREELRASWGPIFRGSGIGFVIGLLPGSAHVLSSFVSYMTEKRLAKRPEEFGSGRIEGVAGPETANNAASGSAMIPFLSLGIPTGPAPAVMMIALLIHGISARTALHLEASRCVLGPDREHVHRKRHADRPESPPRRNLHQPAENSVPHSLSRHSAHLPGRDLFGEYQHLRIGGPSVLRNPGVLYPEDQVRYGASDPGDDHRADDGVEPASGAHAQRRLLL